MHPTAVFTALSVCGLDFPFTLCKRGLPSSLYTFLLKEAWLGITIRMQSILVGFPEFDR